MNNSNGPAPERVLEQLVTILEERQIFASKGVTLTKQLEATSRELELQKQENIRLRNWCEEHGLDPDGTAPDSPGKAEK